MTRSSMSNTGRIYNYYKNFSRKEIQRCSNNFFTLKVKKFSNQVRNYRLQFKAIL